MGRGPAVIVLVNGLLVAEKQFRRIQGYKQIPVLIKELETMAPAKPRLVKRRKAS